MAIAIIWQTVFGVQITAGPLEAAIDVDLVGSSSFGLGGICLRSVARVGMLVCGLHLVNCAPLEGVPALWGIPQA